MKKLLTITAILFTLQSFAQDTAFKKRKILTDSFLVEYRYNRKVYMDKDTTRANRILHYPATIVVYKYINKKKVLIGLPQKGIYVTTGALQDDPFYYIFKAIKSSE